MNIPNVLWGEAVNHAVYVLNNVSTKALKDATPYEMWTGRKPHVGHLRVFGCTAHMKIAKNHLNKIEDRSKRVVYLGTEKGSKAHRLLDLDTGSMYVSMDVEEEINPEPYTPQNNHESSYSDSNWIGEEQPINSRLGSQASPQSTSINQLGTPNSPTSPATPNLPNSPIPSINSPSTASSSTGEGALKRYRLLLDLVRTKQGIGYDEVFAPVARIEMIRVILALAGSSGWWVHHLDVKSAFLNGRLEEEVYVMHPEGFEKRNEASNVYKLSKALYGLKQAPRAWNDCLDKYLKSLGFTRCYQEYSVYTRKKEGSTLIVGLYVDDLLVTGNCPNDIKEFKVEMKAKFEMSDLGLLTYYLGIEVSQHETGITLKQDAYAKNILNKTWMMDCNATRSPMEHKLKLSK
nr:retrovirus-related Pol polyprotein from transposon TNT 1-94 [Tanacetum cinerariifolium]